MNEEILIKGLEQGPPQKAFGDWSFRRFWRNADASEIRLVRQDEPAEQAQSPVSQNEPVPGPQGS
jgi:hypothetical protein